jgi:iron(III) transport system ATP-binding protein
MIKLTGLTKVFNLKGIAGLHSVDLDIPQGVILALMGPNGSGKTTLLNLLSGKLTSDSGFIDIKGNIHFFETKNPDDSMNVQSFLIDSIQDKSIPQEKKIQLTRDFADIFEFTYQLRQSVGQLSQGQRQKVLMAAELINPSDILFLDEPFIHLDPMARSEVLSDLFRFLRQREMTVIWITHERDEALRFADEVGLMYHGKIVQMSTPIDILTTPKNLFVAQFFGHQNFIKINKENNFWQTPWGPLSFPLLDGEGYLLIPANAWRIDINSPFTGTISHLYTQYFSSVLELQVEERRFKIEFPLKERGQFKIGQKLALTPELNQCLVIPL